MRKQRGFTLIELLIVMAITAIMLMLAAPSFKRTIQSGSMSSSVNTFISDLRYTRSEAVRRGGAVVMCRSDAPEASAPVCGSGTGPNNKGWISGWIVFQDLNNDGVHDVAEPVLRVQAATTSLDQITDSPASTKFQFTATGRLLSSTNTSALHFGGSTFASSVQRVVCVGLGGRARIAGDGTTSCGSTNE